MSIKRVGIIGMGALGTLYGSQIASNAKDIELYFLMTEERAKKTKPVIFNGIEQSFNMAYKPEIKMDFIIFAVKGNSLKDAIELSKSYSTSETIFLSVMNGIISEEKIIESYNPLQVIHAVALGMDTTKINQNVKSVNFGKVYLGITHSNKAILDDVLEVFQKSGIQYVVESDILKRIWNKWILNVGVNQAVTYFESSYGIVQKDGLEREFMIGLMKEALMIAQLEGIDLKEEDIMKNLTLLDSLDSSCMPSMRQDAFLKKHTEVLLFSGTVLELAKKHKLVVPLNQEVFKMVTDMERKY